MGVEIKELQWQAGIHIAVKWKLHTENMETNVRSCNCSKQPV